MEQTLAQIKQYADYLRLSQIKHHGDSIIHQAQIDKPSYLEYTRDLLAREVEQRQRSAYQRRLKMAGLPAGHNLDEFDFNYSAGLSQGQLKQLRQLVWLEQNFNVVLMGPSGTGKTFIASGLLYEAVKQGYKSYFLSMEELITILDMKSSVSSALSKYKRLTKAHLVAIDDIMMFPLKKHQAVAFFHFIDYLHERTSVIITTNKSPKQWAETLEDQVLATALLDRLLYRCEVIKLSGASYRMENRKRIFTSGEDQKIPE